MSRIIFFVIYICIGLCSNQVIGQRYQQNQSQKQSSVTQKSQKPADSNCPDRHGRYSVPGQCDAYLECNDWVGEEKLCPDGLLFNDKASVFAYPCQYPIDVDCQNRARLQPPQATDECPHQFGYYRLGDRSNCGQFMNCADGRGYTFDCPEGLAFNKETYRCDWPDQVEDCDAEAFLGFTCPPEEQIEGLGPAELRFYSSPHDCQHYYICINERPRLYNCGEEKAFDELTNACDDIENVTTCVNGVQIGAKAYQKQSFGNQRKPVGAVSGSGSGSRVGIGSGSGTGSGSGSRVGSGSGIGSGSGSGSRVGSGSGTVGSFTSKEFGKFKQPLGTYNTPKPVTSPTTITTTGKPKSSGYSSSFGTSSFGSNFGSNFGNTKQKSQQSSNFGTSSFGSNFGSNAQQKSQQQTSTFGTSSFGSNFGSNTKQKSQQQSQSIFGSQQQVGSSTFGSQRQNQGGSIFGTQQEQTKSQFGSSGRYQEKTTTTSTERSKTKFGFNDKLNTRGSTRFTGSIF